MKIIFWSDQIWPHIGGVEVMARDFVLELAKRGHEIMILATNESENNPEEDSLGPVRIVRLPFRAAVENKDPILTVKLRQRVIALKEEFKPDLTHVFHHGPCNVFEQLTRNVMPTPYVTTAHLYFRDLEPNSWLRRCFEDADWVTACSVSVMDELIVHMPSLAGRSTALPNAMLVPPVALQPMPHNQRLLCIARLVYPKGFDTALRAVAQLRDRYPRLRLSIAGDGPYRQFLESHAAELGLSDIVEFLGWVQPPDVPQLMSDCDIVLMPSHEEPFGLVAVQAAFVERPLVGGNTGGLPEIVVEGETGFLVDPFDPRANADAIARLLDDEALAERMGKAARQHALATFQWAPFVDEYEAIYKRLVAARTG